ncbi:hypothetical protein TrCOL_g2283 [Triparma columacea]|nr:hypothetical protein TrCOL_g2283 [Triparma columacea]
MDSTTTTTTTTMTSGFAESRKKKRGKPCVLIVDDQRSIVKLMERRLAMEGYEVDTAKNGIEALAFMQNKLYTLVMIDLIMSPMDGLTCVKSLRNWELAVGRASRQRVCAMSATEDEEIIARCKHCDMDFASKPINVNKIINLVNRPDRTFGQSSAIPSLDGGNKDKDTYVMFPVDSTVEIRGRANSDYSSARVVHVNGNGRYKVVRTGDEEVEDDVSSLRLRIQNQVQPVKLLLGQTVECDSRLKGLEGGGYVEGVVVGVEKNSEGEEDMYKVQYPDQVSAEGLTRETLPRSRLLGQPVWPRKRRVTRDELKKVSASETTFSSALERQLGLVQEALDLSTSQEALDLSTSRIPKKTIPKVEPRKLSVSVGGEEEVRGSLTCPTPKRSLNLPNSGKG